MPEYQNIVSTLHTWIQNISTNIGQPVDCEVAGYYVMVDDECHEMLPPNNITCSGIYMCTELISNSYITGVRDV